MSFQRITVLGIPVVASTFANAMERVADWALGQEKAYSVSFADVHVISRGRHEESFGDKLRSMDAVMPDGFPVLKGVNRGLGTDKKLTERVSGPDFFRRFHELAPATPGLKHFYLGGSPSLLSDVLATVAQNCPQVEIVGSYSPPFGNWSVDDLQTMFDKIQSSGANVVWVGLGCPKQENWIADNLKQLPHAVYLAVGAAFAFYTGNVKRAPLWMQKCGIEWLHRLLSEPRRLWKRYFIYNTLFIYYSIIDSFKKPCCN